jgi:PAS domain S-box-containing protein
LLSTEKGLKAMYFSKKVRTHSTKRDRRLELMFAAIETARNGIIITDHRVADEPIIYCNKAFLELTGYSKEEVLGKNCRFLQGQDRNQEARFQLQRAVANGAAVHVQIRNYRKDGTMFWNDLLISPIVDEHGTITHFSGNQLNVSAQKQTEVQLQQEKNALEQHVRERTTELLEVRDYLESIVETIRQPLVVLDEHIHVISANRFFYKTFQVEETQTEGKLLYELGNKQWDIARLRELLEKVLPEQNPFEGFEVEHEFPGIGKRTMVLNARQIELQGSGQQRILLAIEDISQRRGAEHSSQRSQALTQAMINSLNDHIAVLDRRGIILEVNQAWENFADQKIEGTQEEGAYVGLNYLKILQSVKGDDAQEATLAYEGIEKVMEQSIPQFSLEYSCLTPHARHWFLLQATPLKHEEGGVVVAHIDITERKQVEMRKDDFISMASHELKTPITSMQLNIQTLEKYFHQRDEKIAVRGLAKVHTQIKKLTRLVNELLDVSRIYAGKLEIQNKPFDIIALTHQVVEDFTDGKTSRQFIFVEDRTSMVVGDPDRVEQVLTNLFTNAIKYSPEHSAITVQIAEKGEYNVISVHDQGIGISKEQQAHVFERFYQVANAEGATYPGLGMGLYISDHIVQNHGGTMWVESQQGEGTTFFFSIPTLKRMKKETLVPPIVSL